MHNCSRRLLWKSENRDRPGDMSLKLRPSGRWPVSNRRVSLWSHVSIHYSYLSSVSPPSPPRHITSAKPPNVTDTPPPLYQSPSGVRHNWLCMYIHLQLMASPQLLTVPCRHKPIKATRSRPDTNVLPSFPLARLWPHRQSRFRAASAWAQIE